MRMGTDHNQMMNELEVQSRLLTEIRDLLRMLVQLQPNVYPISAGPTKDETFTPVT